MSGGYSGAYLASKIQTDKSGRTSNNVTNNNNSSTARSQPPLITHKVHTRQSTLTPILEDDRESHQVAHTSAPSSSSAQNSLLDPREWQKIMKFHTPMHQQSKKEVPLSSSLRLHPSSFEGTKLSLANCEISNIDNISSTLALRVKTLYLGTNNLSSIGNIVQFSNLSTASLSNNCIRYLDELRPLGILQQLEKLSLDGNIVTSMPYYREYMIGMCTHLHSLDNKAVSSSERTAGHPTAVQVSATFRRLRCNELRYAILLHALHMSKCRAELQLNFAYSLDPAPPLPVLIARVAAGGAYRWVEIGCAAQFDRVVQDMSLRAHLQVLRKVSQAQRLQLSHRSDQLKSHWDNIARQCQAYQVSQLHRFFNAYNSVCGIEPDNEGAYCDSSQDLGFTEVLDFEPGASVDEHARWYTGVPALGLPSDLSLGDRSEGDRSLRVEGARTTAGTVHHNRHPISTNPQAHSAVEGSPARSKSKSNSNSPERPHAPPRKPAEFNAGVSVLSSIPSVPQSTTTRYQNLLSRLLPPQQLDPDATPGLASKKTAPSPFPIPSVAPIVPTKSVISSSIRVKSTAAAMRGKSPATADRPNRLAASPPRSTASSHTSRPLSAAAAQSKDSKTKQPSKVTKTGSSSNNDGIDFTSEQFKSLLQRAKREFPLSDPDDLVRKLQSFWSRPLPELDVAHLAMIPKSSDPPRPPYHRLEHAQAINTMKAQIQTTLNELSQYQRDEYLAWCASEALHGYCEVTRMAVQGSCDAAIGDMAVWKTLGNEWRDDADVASKWVESVEGLIESIAAEREKIALAQDAAIQAERRREAVVSAQQGEDRRKAALAKTSQEVNLATAAMIAQIDADPALAKRVRNDLALSAATDLIDRPTALLRRIIRQWRLRVRRQRRIKKFAVSMKRKQRTWTFQYFFSSWAAHMKIALVSRKLQRRAARRGARKFIRLLLNRARRARRLVRLCKKKLYAPLRVSIKWWLNVMRAARGDGFEFRKLELRASRFMKRRIFTGWAKYTRLCNADPKKELADSARARRFHTSKLLRSWAHVAGQRAAQTAHFMEIAAKQHRRNWALRIMKDWRKQSHASIQSRVSTLRRGMRAWVKACLKARRWQRTRLVVTRIRLERTASRWVRLLHRITIRNKRATVVGRRISLRYVGGLKFRCWRIWAYMMRVAEHDMAMNESAMTFYLKLSLRRHFYAWRELHFGPAQSTKHLDALPAAPERPIQPGPPSSIGATSVDPRSIADSILAESEQLAKSLHSQLAHDELCLYKAHCFFFWDRAKQVFATLGLLSIRKSRLRKQYGLVARKAVLWSQRIYFRRMQNTWISSLQRALRGHSDEHPRPRDDEDSVRVSFGEANRVGRANMTLLSQAATASRALQEANTRHEALIHQIEAARPLLTEIAARREWLVDCHNQRSSRMEDISLSLRELKVTTSALQRQREQREENIAQLQRECQAIMLLQSAHTDLNSRIRSEEELLAGQMLEKENERDTQRRLLQSTEEAYSRAVLLESQAQLQMERLGAEMRASLQISAHHRDVVQAADKKIVALKVRRAKTEQALAFCVQSLQDSMDKIEVSRAKSGPAHMIHDIFVQLIPFFYPCTSCRPQAARGNGELVALERDEESTRQRLEVARQAEEALRAELEMLEEAERDVRGDMTGSAPSTAAALDALVHVGETRASLLAAERLVSSNGNQLSEEDDYNSMRDAAWHGVEVAVGGCDAFTNGPYLGNKRGGYGATTSSILLDEDTMDDDAMKENTRYQQHSNLNQRAIREKSHDGPRLQVLPQHPRKGAASKPTNVRTAPSAPIRAGTRQPLRKPQSSTKSSRTVTLAATTSGRDALFNDDPLAGAPSAAEAEVLARLKKRLGSGL